MASDRIKILTEIRDQLMDTMTQAEPRELAALARELRATLAELDALGAGREESALDDLAKRRAARRESA